MKKKISAYWWCQIGGWSTYILTYTFFYFTIATRQQPFFFNVLFLDAGFGLAITHLMRYFILQAGLLNKRLNQQIIHMFLTTFGFSFLFAFMTVWTEQVLGWEADRMRELSLWNKVLYASFGSFLFLAIWNLIYFAYHFVEKSRQEQIDKIKLERLVKDLELKTIKAHINPHFIFNALNSIRALVDENPGRARTAITELSNILRSSMHAEKTETTSLERELSIVKDYLALEHIRFEDRLRVEYDIDEETLDQQVPPMMLQTLVENAIKHGISKQIEGGKIKIISDFKNNHYELVVQNTGKLNGSRNPDGFGIASTMSRLKLMYGEDAKFRISDASENLVEAKVIMPLNG